MLHDEAGRATPDEDAAIDVFNDRLQAEGHWVFAGGLAAPDTATVVDNRGEGPVFTDGPFVETTEYFAGFLIIEAADRDVAFKLAAEGAKACNRKVEVRPVLRGALGRRGDHPGTGGSVPGDRRPGGECLKGANMIGQVVIGWKRATVITSDPGAHPPGDQAGPDRALAIGGLPWATGNDGSS